MATVYQPSYQIAVGNNNAAGLTSLEALTPASDTHFAPVRVYWNYDPGARRIRSDGTLYHAGFPSQVWQASVLTKSQWQYLKATYCNSGYSGAVTIRTRFSDPTTYANYNAILTLPKEIETQQRSRVYIDVALTFTRLVAL